MKKVVFLFVLALGFAWNCDAQTWTFVQDSVATVCNSGSSSCSMNPNIAPTTAGTIWVVRIHTPNNVAISSVSGGSATWHLCPSCHVFNSATSDNQDLAYGFNGSAGTTSINVTLSAPAGSFFGGNFIEILPPSGSTASFDTAGTTASSTCTTACAGPTLTLSGTDVVIESLSGAGPAAWNSWSSPYITDFTGNGIGLNISSGAAPTVNVGTSPGGDITAIAFKSSLGNFTPPPSGPISIVNYVNPRGINCSPSCALAIPSTGVGHLLFLQAGNLGGGLISSVSGGGTWVVPTGSNSCGISMSGGALSCAYVLSSASGTTSLNVTLTGTANTSFTVTELSSSTGVFAFDTQGSATNSAQFFPKGISLTLNGTSPDVVFQGALIPGGASNASFYPQPLDGFNFVFTDATFGILTNVTSATSPDPIFDDLQSNQTIVTGIAFKTAAGTIPNPPSGLIAVVN